MGRSDRAIQSVMFPDMVAPGAEDGAIVEASKGRAPELIAARNEKLLHRLAYLRRHQPKVLGEFHIEQLAKEFDLSERTIADIIQEEQAELRRIGREWPGEKVLRKKWPWLEWSWLPDTK